MPKRPIARVCPTCGSKEFTSCKPEGFVAFVNDRKCKECKTLYKMPTPVWAGLIFVIIGLAMLVGGLISLALLLRHPIPNPIGMAINSCVAAVGVLAMWHGSRAVFRPGKV